MVVYWFIFKPEQQPCITKAIHFEDPLHYAPHNLKLTILMIHEQAVWHEKDDVAKAHERQDETNCLDGVPISVEIVVERQQTYDQCVDDEIHTHNSHFLLFFIKLQCIAQSNYSLCWPWDSNGQNSVLSIVFKGEEEALTDNRYHYESAVNWLAEAVGQGQND
jgi:hypothetical protein